MTIHLLSQLRTHDPVILTRANGSTTEAEFMRLCDDPVGAWFMTDFGQEFVTTAELNNCYTIDTNEILR